MSNNPYDIPSSDWYRTYHMYRRYIDYKKPYSYKKWLSLPDNYKAAALYCQFFNEITLAWHKVKTAWAIEQEGIEVINQYLIKNVEKIKQDKKRFRAPYIYTVAYNCLYCVCIDPSYRKDCYYNETSSELMLNDDEDFGWFDVIGTEEDVTEFDNFSKITKFFESLGEADQIYISYLLGEITEYQACRKLKSLGVIFGDIRSSASRNIIFTDFLRLKKSEMIRTLKEYSSKNNICFDSLY